MHITKSTHNRYHGEPKLLLLGLRKPLTSVKLRIISSSTVQSARLESAELQELELDPDIKLHIVVYMSGYHHHHHILRLWIRGTYMSSNTSSKREFRPRSAKSLCNTFQNRGYYFCKAL